MRQFIHLHQYGVNPNSEKYKHSSLEKDIAGRKE